MKVKERKDKVKLRLNGGELNIAIDREGNVLEFGESAETYKQGWLKVLTAKELDQIASKSRLLESVGAMIKDICDKIEVALVPASTEHTCHDITFNDDTYSMECGNDFNGAVTFGCQEVSAEDIAKVHALSRKARGLKPIK